MKDNKCLYFLKGISCLIVIFLHIPFPGIIGNAIIYGLRFSVPIFFMISGYVCYFRDLKWIKRSCLKILRLLLLSEAACALVKILFCERGVIEQNAMRVWSHPFSTVMFGAVFNDSLWYLYAMVWTWICVYFLKAYHGMKKAYLLIPILLTVHIAGRLAVQRYGDINEWIMFFRSWILYGLPFVLLGHYIAENGKSRGITNRMCALLLVAGGAVMIGEYVIFRSYMDIWFSTLLISLSLFLFALVNPERAVVPVVAKIGKRYSKIIYVSHIPVSIVIEALSGEENLIPETVYGYAKPFMVLVGSLLTAVIAERLSMIRRGK